MSGADGSADSPAQSAARHESELRVLQRVSSEINGSLSLAEIYSVALRTMEELFGFQHSIILLADAAGEELTVVASRGYEGQAIGGRVGVGTGVIGVVAKRRRPMQLGRMGGVRSYVSAQRRGMIEAGREAELGDYVPVPGLPNAESQIAIPLLVRDELIGVFSVETPAPRAFGEHDKDLVTIVANQTASAIRSARLLAALSDANQTLEERVRERTAELERELRVARETRQHARARLEAPLVGSGARLAALRESMRAAAAAGGTLLLFGPPGAGKEAIARAIHDESPRKSGPFLYVSCAQVRTRGQPSLFGSQPGARAPGAAETSQLDLAHGGTLYLDAVTELPPEIQSELAMLLESQERARREGKAPFPDARVVAGTARDLWQDARAGRFDMALCRALAAAQITLPGLAERLEDLPAIVDHVIRWHSQRLGKSIERVSEESMRKLVAYRWPGNVRELENILERAVMVSAGPVLEIEEELLQEGISLGSYRLVEQLGAGGMGEVWLGRHRLLARPAAVKIIRRSAIESYGANIEKRFLREAQVTAELSSPHTVQLYDFGVTETGTFYYVMELLHGMDLNEMVKRFGPFPAERVVALLDQACASLGEAHERGLVHRDIKPGNLFVAQLGGVSDFLKVLDFGMVKASDEEDAAQLTTAGKVHGTPAFMPPEVALGEDLDGRSDLYSLGCAAYWMLTGKIVFDAPSPTAMLMRHVQATPSAPSRASELSIPAALDAIVLRCLEKRPADRPQSAAQLRAELARVELREPWTQERAAAWWQRHGAAR